MYVGNSLEVQWLGLHAFIAKDQGLIPGQGTKILQAMQRGQKKKKKKKMYAPPFTAALFTIPKIWKELKCSLMYEWIKKLCVYTQIHTHWDIV